MKKYYKQTLLFLIIIGLTTWLSACSRVTQENFDKIQPGMTMEQVINILGEPTSSESINFMGVSGTSAKWKSNNAVIIIQFLNNTVQVKTFDKVTKPHPMEGNIQKTNY